MNLTIGISTFKHRLQSLKSLVLQIRAINKDIQIIIAVNGEYNEAFDEQYRKDLLRFCADQYNILLIMFPEFRSLSKLWNEIIVHSATEFIYMLNDDVNFENNEVFQTIEKTISQGHELFMCPINSWSHFVISKTIADKLGYFDERLLGIGEEDGDIEWRFIERFGKRVYGVPNVHGIYNKGEYDSPNKVKVWTQNKTSFNHSFIYGVKYKNSAHGIKGMFDVPLEQELHNEKQYPYESFYKRHKDKL